MIVSVHQFRKQAQSVDGVDLEMGAERIASEQRTTDGAFAALSAGVQFVRVATDTAITIDPYGEGSGEEVFMPAGSVEFFPAAAGQVLTIATVA